ncbi:MAG: methionine--tRNA ligase [Phycisphaerae bacterium]|nr:methionine--tRNA ligase [Phycisphaerae bacterium]
MPTAYITTPIYYVNDRPHIGHCYTSAVADAAARYQRLFGKDVFFLTGTDEHADKVVTEGAKHGFSPQAWADRNAAEFEKAFALMGFSHDDFMRTTQERHRAKVIEYVTRLKDHGDVYLGDYVGWYDLSQDEYLTEIVAKDSPHGPYTSPVTGRPLVRRTEKNWFFRLSAYEDRLKKHLADNPDFVQPDARRNEVLGRLRDGLQDIPLSRPITPDPASQWGIRLPGDESQRIYVWIDALFNYLSCVDTPARRKYWPPAVHVMAKDILWFHAVIWPALLMALGEPLPQQVYAHAYWVREGKKMSKSLGNFVDIDVLGAYVARYSRDAVRYYLIAQGPMYATDADFSHAKFVEVYNADLANGIGNATSRVGNMIAKYFDGRCPDPKGVAEHAGFDWPAIIRQHVERCIAKADAMDIPGAAGEGLALSRQVDAYINVTEPFKLAKKIAPGAPGAGGQADGDAARDLLGAILYHCAEALRVAALMLSPIIPEAAAKVAANWSCRPLILAEGHALAHAALWGGHHALQPGQAMAKGEPLFMRADPAEPPPSSAAPSPAPSPVA